VSSTKADWNLAKPSAQISALISAALRGLHRDVGKVPRAFLTRFCRNPRSRSNFAVPCRSSVAELTGLFRRQLGGSVANDANGRVVHESACRRPTPCGIDLPTINHANGRNRFCAHALHFDTLRDERAGDENRLLSHFFLSLLAPLDRRIGKALAAIKTVTPAAAITLFTKQDTPAGLRCKSSNKAGLNTRRTDPSHVYPGFKRFRWN